MSLERLVSGLGLAEVAPNADGLQLARPVSWSIWARIPDDPTGSTIRSVFSFCSTTTGLSGYNLMALNSKMHFYLRMTPPQVWKIVSADANVDSGWHHYAGRTFTVGTDDLYVVFYVDGVEQSGTIHLTPGPFPVIAYQAVSLKLQMGQYITTNLHCVFADFAIWNSDIGAGEIAWIAQSRRAGGATMMRRATAISGLPPTPDYLKAFWACDELLAGNNMAVDMKYIQNRGGTAGVGATLAPWGSGNMWGREIPLVCSHSARLVTIDAAGPPQGIDMDALSLAGAARSLVVSPGGVSIAMLPASGSIWADDWPWGEGGGLIGGAMQVTVAPGETLRAMGALGLTGTLKSLQVIPGELVTALSVLTSTGQALTVATTTGPVTLLLNRALLASSAATVGVSFGEFITRLAALSAQLSIPSIGVIPGEKITALSDLVLSATGRQLTVLPGEMVTTMDALALASGVGAVVIVPGGASIPMDVLTLASYIPILVTTNGVAIHLSPLHLTGSLGSVTVSTGPVSVMATVLSLGSSIPALHLYSIKRTDMAALVAAFMPQGVSVVPGATARGMSPVTLVTSIPQLDVAPGEAFQLMDSLLLTATPMRATVPRDVQVLLDAVTATLYATNTRGMFGVRIFMNPAQITAAAVAIGTIGGILLIPDGRRIVVLGENRLMIVSGEERILVVPAEM